VAQPALPPADREFYTLLEEELQAHAWPANEALAAAAKEAREHITAQLVRFGIECVPAESDQAWVRRVIDVCH
jgi:hypothetical protein